MKIFFTSLVFREGNMYVTYCPEFDVSSCGHNVNEAKKNLKEAVNILLEETEKMGTLKDILCEAGYAPADKKHKEWSPPALISAERVRLITPFGA